MVKIFPLSLNAIEHYMLADDSADYTRCFFIAVRLNERLDESRLIAAIDSATKRHPLLRALVAYDGDRPKQWVECHDPRYPIDGQAGSAASSGDYEQVIPPIDLRRQSGLRFQLRREAEGDALCVEFHHACTDGLGAVQFVGDLLAAYGTEAGAAQSTFPPLDEQLLATRDSLGLTGWRRPLRWLYGSLGWLGAIEFLAHRPAPLGKLPAASASPGNRASGFCWRALTAEESWAVILAAKHDGVTVNDLLMRDVFVALQEFIERHWPARTRDHKRIMVPTNLRVAGDERMPAANVVAMINLDRRPHRWTDRRRMLRVLHWELTAVKRLRLGVVFVQILHTLQTLFGSLRSFLPADRCQATCVVSNLGPVFPTIGTEVIRAIEFYPPIRPLTSAAFGVATHGGRIMLSLHYDASALSAEEGAELIDRVIDHLRENVVATESESVLAPAN